MGKGAEAEQTDKRPLKVYVTPRLIEFGDVKRLTAAGSPGSVENCVSPFCQEAGMQQQLP